MEYHNQPESNIPTKDNTTTARKQRKAIYRRIIRWIWGLFLVGLVSILSLFFLLSFQLPSFEQLENPKLRIATEIYASDGVLLGKYYVENRTPVPYDSI